MNLKGRELGSSGSTTKPCHKISVSPLVMLYIWHLNWSFVKELKSFCVGRAGLTASYSYESL